MMDKQYNILYCFDQNILIIVYLIEQKRHHNSFELPSSLYNNYMANLYFSFYQEFLLTFQKQHLHNMNNHIYKN